MIPIGKKCPVCSKIHLCKSIGELERLSPKERIKTYKTVHRLFQAGYYCSLDRDSEDSGNSEVWEFYTPLSVFKLEFLHEKELEKKKTDLEQYVEELYEVEEEEDE